MKRRRRISRSKSKRDFRSNSFAHPRNDRRPMRGGFRI